MVFRLLQDPTLNLKAAPRYSEKLNELICARSRWLYCLRLFPSAGLQQLRWKGALPRLLRPGV